MSKNKTSPVKLSIGLEISPYDVDGGELIGKHPDELNRAQIARIGIRRAMRAIRTHCINCAGSGAEARKCVAVDCELWLYRMGKRPKALSGVPISSLEKE